MSIKDKYTVKSIDTYLCKDWLINKHYLKRIPSISYSFGLFYDNILTGIMTFGNALPNQSKISICGNDYSKYVYELNRLCINVTNDKNLGSYFISKVFKLLPKPMIILTYADTANFHHGYIYQSSNFIYTGLSHVQKDWVLKGSENKHSRTLMDEFPYQKNRIEKLKIKYGNDLYQVMRKPKHRYIYFLGTKKDIIKFKSNSLFKIYPYPKGDNVRYDASYQPVIQTSLF